MTSDDQCQLSAKLVKTAIIEEPCLKLPVIDEPEFGIDDQFDMLDSLTYDALLEEDIPPLPIVDPKIGQWIDQLEELVERQWKPVSDAHVQEEPVLHAEKEEERTVPPMKVNKGQQDDPEPTLCDICNEEFLYSVNVKRHKWRHCHKAEEEAIESTKDQFKDYFEKLKDEKAHKIISIKDAVLPANFSEQHFNDIIDAVSSYIEALDEDSRRLEVNSVVAFFLNPEAADKWPTFQAILTVLDFLSDGNVFRGTLNLEMQNIVFPHGISVAEIKEQGLLTSFGFLLEYSMMKVWADDQKGMADLLEKEVVLH